MAEIIVGIDLGTTNSEIAVIEKGVPRVLAGDDGDPILPSFVGITEDGKLLVGKPARNQYPLAPERTIKSIKRQMGKQTQVTLGNHQYSPPEISAMILKTLKDRAEKYLGQPVQKAVITVPAYFNDTQRQATIEAGRIAGLQVVRILNEPTAAALTYDPQHEQSQRVLVYDLGGGTFDVSIVQSENGVVEVLASHGDTYLGGDDFDELLLNFICEQFEKEHGIDLRQNRTTRARILRAAENAKRQLSDHAFFKLEEEFIAEKDGVALHLTQELSRADFEKLIVPLLDRTIDCVQRTLDDAKLNPSQIDRLVLVGGSTRIPIISQRLEEKMGRPARRDINPDLCVAMGAAIQGAMIAGESIGSVLVDVTPHSLGIKALRSNPSMNPYITAKVIHRNTPIPTSRSEVFYTAVDNQSTVKIEVFQGESEDPRRNHPLGDFQVEGLSRAPAGNPIVVQFDLDANGVLKVSAREKATGLSRNITIDNATKFKGEQETAVATERLNQLWRDNFEPEDTTPLPPEEDENDLELEEENFGPVERLPEVPVGQRESVLAKALLEKAERIRENASPEDQAELDLLTETVRLHLDTQNWSELEVACGRLSDVLFYMEDS